MPVHLCLTLGNPVDYSSPGSSVHGILQVRILVWVAITFSRGSSWPRDRTQVLHFRQILYHLRHQASPGAYVCIFIFVHCMLSHFSHIQCFAALWTIACQAPLSMGFSRQEYWSGLLCYTPGALPYPRIKLVSLNISCIAGEFFITSAAREAHIYIYLYINEMSDCKNVTESTDNQRDLIRV